MEKKSQKEKVKQLDLGLKSPFKNYIYSLKDRFLKSFMFVESNSFLKDQAIWFLICFQVVLILSQLLYLLKSINMLPQILKVINFPSSIELSVINKHYLLLFPFISLIIFMFGLKTARKNYFKWRAVSMYILFVVSLVVLFISLHMFRIVSHYNG